MNYLISYLFVFLLTFFANNAYSQNLLGPSLCPALDRINATIPVQRNCGALANQAAICRCEVNNARALSQFELRRQEAQFRCDMRMARRALNNSTRQARQQCRPANQN